MRALILGAGIFGAMTAIRLSALGYKCTIVDRLSGLMTGASAIANRVHRGFHYPRHEETARQCMLGYERFLREFSGAILDNVQNAYFISSRDSSVSVDDYVAFCDKLELQYQEIDASSYPIAVSDVALRILTTERMFDPDALRQILLERLGRADVQLIFATEAHRIEAECGGSYSVVTSQGKLSSDVVVNCGYSGGQLVDTPHVARQVRQYEYVAVPIVQWAGRSTFSASVLDGPFPGLLPIGKQGSYLLYHVEHSVIDRVLAFAPPPAWLNVVLPPASHLANANWFGSTIESSRRFFPDIDEAQLVGVWQGVRVVRADVDSSDERPTLVSIDGPGLVSVFSGKVVHSTWVGEQVARAIEDSFATL